LGLVVASQVEGEILGGVRAGAGSFFEGYVADVEGTLDVFVAFDEVFDGEELDAGVWCQKGPGLKPGLFLCHYRLRPKAKALGYQPAASPKDNYGDSDSSSQNDASKGEGVFQRHLKPAATPQIQRARVFSSL